MSCSNRRRQRPQRYSVDEFVEAVSDNDVDFDSDDDIVGEVVYHDDYLRNRKKRRKTSSSSEGDEEYNWDDENPEEEEEEEEEEEDDILSTSEDSGEQWRRRPLPGRTRRETRSRLVDDIQSGLRRSKRATRNHINYKQYDVSESDNESVKPEKSNASSERSYASDNADFSTGSDDSDEKINGPDDMHIDAPIEEQHPEAVDEEQTDPPEETTNHRDQEEEEEEGVQKKIGRAHV